MSGFIAPESIVKGKSKKIYLHSSSENFISTYSYWGLFQKVKDERKAAKKRALEHVQYLKEKFYKVEEQMLKDLREAGISTDRESIKEIFQDALSGERIEHNFITATVDIKEAIRTSKQRGKVESYSILKKRVDKMLKILDKVENEYGKLFEGIVKAKYKSSLGEIKRYRKEIMKDVPYSKQAYNKQTQLTAELGRLLEPMITSLANTEIRSSLLNLAKGDKNIEVSFRDVGAGLSARSTSDISFDLGQNTSYGIDVKSSDFSYNNQRTYSLIEALDEGSIGNINTMRYLTFNLLNLFGTFQDIGGNFRQLYNALKGLFFFATFTQNLVGSKWDPKTANEVFIITPKKVMFFSDFLESIQEQLKSSRDSFSKFGSTTLHGVRTTKSNSREQLRRESNSARGRLYRAKLATMKNKNLIRGAQSNYPILHSDSNVSTEMENLQTELNRLSKIVTRIKINTSNIK